MCRYAEVALRATQLMSKHACASPVEAWRVAAQEIFPGKRASQAKSCPKGAFLGLCEDGLVVGIAVGAYAAGSENKGYAVEAVRLLGQDPALAAAGPRALWKRVMGGREKVPNHQMEVVLALWSNGLIRGS